MKLSRLLVALVSAACFQMSSASAQDVQSRTRGFVEEVALSRSSDDGLARWDERVCVGAVGLNPAEAQALVDRISARAQAVGLRAGSPGCRANVMVIYSQDSDAVTRQIVDQRRDLLGFYAEDGRVTAGRDAMEEFANTPRPVRWWHISSTGVGSMRPDAQRERQASGQTSAAVAAGSPGMTGGGAGSLNDIQGTSAVRSNGSRARAEVRNELTYALVVVDARRVANVPTGAWMDYVALTALAQLDPSAHTNAYPTILNLFSSPDLAPAQLTAWDIAYLDGLYRARSEESVRQVASIARRMADHVPAQ